MLRSNSRLTMTFSELVRLLEREGFRLVKEKGPTGTCHAILKAAGIERGAQR